MTKIDKKIIDIIDLLSKSMTKNNLSEIEISNGSSVFKLKKLVKESNDSRNNEIFEQSISKKTDEPSISVSRSMSKKVCRGWSDSRNWTSFTYN